MKSILKFTADYRTPITVALWLGTLELTLLWWFIVVQPCVP